MDKIFRITIIISSILTVLMWVLPYFNYANFTQDEFDIMSWTSFGTSLPFNDLFSFGLLTAWLVTNLGLYFFIKPFRSIFAILVIGTTLLSLFLGIAIYPPIEFAIFTAVTMLDGAIITMLYLTSISAKFSNPNKALKQGREKASRPLA